MLFRSRSVGASPLERCIAETARCTNRDQLAAWAEQVWVDGDVDPIRSRVAEEVDRFLTSNEPGGFRSWIDARQPFDDLEPDDDEGAVALLTFHAAKGREWSAVVVTGVEAGLVPHSSSTTPAQKAEEARLFYVALTRAGDELVITSAASRNGNATGPSPWTAAVEATTELDRSVPPPSPVRTVRPVDPLAPLREWRTAVARAAGVNDTAICPDSTLRAMLADPPTDADAIAVRLGLGRSAAERLAPRLLGLLGTAGTS